MSKKIVRVVTLDSDGSMKTRDFDSVDSIIEMHEQIGIDDCSTDLTLRGFPIFRGLVGPIPESKIARYESPDVFEAMTKEWTQKKAKRRRRRKPAEIAADKAAAEAAEAAKLNGVPIPAPMGLGGEIPASTNEMV